MSSTTMDVDKKKMTLTLLSSDGDVFEIDEEVAMESQAIKHIIEDKCANNTIPLPNVTSKILSKAIDYCKKRLESGTKAEEWIYNGNLMAWADDYLTVDQATLCHLIKAANYLEIKGLLDLTCQKVAGMMKGKSIDEIRKTFNIKNDYTAEEEEEVRRENQWIFGADQ